MAAVVVAAFACTIIVGLLIRRRFHFRPGDVVWARIPFEDNPRKGKDRPVMVYARQGFRLEVVKFTSKSARHGRPGYVHVGPGPWDPKHRDTWADANRTITISSWSVRRRGGTVSPDVAAAVIGTLRGRSRS